MPPLPEPQRYRCTAFVSVYEEPAPTAWNMGVLRRGDVFTVYERRGNFVRCEHGWVGASDGTRWLIEQTDSAARVTPLRAHEPLSDNQQRPEEHPPPAPA
eukprot:SAG22_NODE_3509_length_1672_cov_1.306421_1_plen_99_part_10